MKPKKLIRYRLAISRQFPAKHPRKGEKTLFYFNILEGNKIHTIRANYELWAKRFEKIDRGEAVLELYFWSGKPYRSKSIAFCRMGKDDGIGIQKLEFQGNSIEFPYVTTNGIRHENFYSIAELSTNDGLYEPDFKAWFKGYDLRKPMAIIHFTKFRY
jgi:hypothetical protein